MAGRSKSISIFEYTDFRTFLRDHYRATKAERATYSFRAFSRAAGFSSPNFLKLVMEGERNLSPDSIDRFARALRFNKEEAAFFRSLVHLNQARTSSEKAQYAEQLLRCRPFREMHPLSSAQFAYYSSWHLVAVRELIDTRDFRDDPEWIARRLEPPITPDEVVRALEHLGKLGLVERDEAGRLRQKQAMLSTDDEVISASVAQFHREMMRKGAEAIDRFEPAAREISSVTMSLSEDGYRQAKELVQRFRRELMEIAGKDRGQTAVHQFNFQLFPLARPASEPEAEK